MSRAFLPVALLAAALLSLLPAGCSSAAAGQRASVSASGSAGQGQVEPAPGAAQGIDALGLRFAAAGYLVELRFRVVDAGKAAPLFDPRSRLEVVNDTTGRTLPGAPLFEKLRPAGTPAVGQTYAIELDNTERLVSPGDRLTVRLGPLEARGLPVTPSSAAGPDR